ncbi:hypothetical protein Q7C36_012995 [Tachysurus vachellii]|uniref:Uncharacterized protein n=1 Tax=Tachysurus vachellii TaxID=175792 RepID=A0AA88MS18_TACVA|nr:hypothetical protein Q7C36_012995 [Tachysurus vachellii]
MPEVPRLNVTSCSNGRGQNGLSRNTIRSSTAPPAEGSHNGNHTGAINPNQRGFPFKALHSPDFGLAK